MDASKDIDELIKHHLRPQLFNDIRVVERAANLFISLESQFISSVNGETFYKLPYKAITLHIFDSDLEEIKGNAMEGFSTTVAEVLVELCFENQALPHLIDCYEKFTHHIELALTQKEFILKSAKLANEVATAAKSVADTANDAAHEADEVSKRVEQALIKANQTIQAAQEGANKALRLSTQANDALETAKSVAKKAESTAEHAQKLATEADAQAKSTIANYISILGIFASIIFTLFGGVNLIGATVKLLEANSRLPYLTFVIALLMICLLTLLNMMVKWIGATSNLRDKLDRIASDQNDQTDQNGGNGNNPSRYSKLLGLDFYTKSVIFFMVIVVISLAGMYQVKKEHAYSFSSEKTTKSLNPATQVKVDDSVASNTASNVDDGAVRQDAGNNTDNIETTVVEKYIISNKPTEQPKPADTKKE